jgi:hypothetical protein
MPYDMLGNMAADCRLPHKRDVLTLVVFDFRSLIGVTLARAKMVVDILRFWFQSRPRGRKDPLMNEGVRTEYR